MIDLVAEKGNDTATSVCLDLKPPYMAQIAGVYTKSTNIFATDSG